MLVLLIHGSNTKLGAQMQLYSADIQLSGLYVIHELERYQVLSRNKICST